MLENRRIAFLASLGFSKWEPDEVVKTLSDLGYSGVEWTLAHFNPRNKSEAELRRLVEVTAGKGMEVSEIVVQQDFVSLDEKLREDRISLVKECIEAAGKTGVGTINLFTGPAPWDKKAPRISEDISEGEAWAQVVDAFQQVIKEAERYKVYLAVEAVFGHLAHDYYTTRELFRAVDSEYLGINMDPSHYVLYGNDAPWVVRQWGGKIKHVHLKDVVGKPGTMRKDFVFPLLGEGVVDWKGFITSLDEIGYTGFLSVEFESFIYYARVLGEDPVEAARLSMDQVRRLLRF